MISLEVVFITIDKNDLEIILSLKDEVQCKYEKSIVTEIQPLSCFYDAEDYHQKYPTKKSWRICHIDLKLIGTKIIKTRVCKIYTSLFLISLFSNILLI